MQNIGPSHAVLFPEGWRRVAAIARECGSAVGVSQIDKEVHVNTGRRTFVIDMFGNDIHTPEQE